MKNHSYIPALIAAFILLVFLFHGVFAGSAVIFKDQAYEFHYQSLAYLKTQLANGDFPLWNRHAAMGEPFAAYPEYSIYYPLMIPASYLFKPMVAVNILILLQYLMIAGFTAALARSLGLSKTGGAISGIGFAFCGYLLMLHTEFQSLGALAALPASIYFFERYAQTANWSYATGSGLALGIGHLAGGTQYSYYVDILFFFWAIFISGRERSIPVSWPKKTMAAVLAAVISVAVAAVVLLPASQMAKRSLRAQVDFEQAAHSPKGDLDRGFDIGPSALPGFIYPKDPGMDPVQTKPVHFGVIILALAIFGAIRSKGRTRALLLAVIVFSLLMAAGRHTPAFGIFYSLPIPGMGMFKNPVRMIVLAVFCTAILAGYGVDILLEEKRKHKTVAAVIFSIAFAVTLILATRSGAVYPGMIMIFASLAVVFTLIFIPEKNPFVPRLWLIIAVCLSMGAAYPAIDLLPMDEVQKRVQGSPFKDILTQSSHSRAFSYNARPYFQHYNNHDLVENTGMAQGISLVDGNSSLHSDRYLWFTAAGKDVDPIQQYALPDFIFHEPLRVMANTPFIVSEEGAPYPVVGVEKVVSRGGNALYRSEGAKAVRIVEKWICSKNKSQSKILLEKHRDDSPLTDIIESSDCKPGQSPPGQADIMKRSADSIHIEVQSPGRGYLFISESYASGWRAGSGGKELEVYPAGLAFMAVPINENITEVTLSYKPRSFYTGATISLLSTLMAIGAILFFRVKKYRPSGNQQ